LAKVLIIKSNGDPGATPAMNLIGLSGYAAKVGEDNSKQLIKAKDRPTINLRFMRSP
jgi:hypothetical protein